MVRKQRTLAKSKEPQHLDSANSLKKASTILVSNPQTLTTSGSNTLIQGQIEPNEKQIINEILDHALDFNHKKRVEDLNLLDILNSYDEMIQNYQISKDKGQQIYRKLLQIQRSNGKEEKKQTIEKENLSSNYETLNQDLQFDFLGSFGGQNNNQEQIKTSKQRQNSISFNNEGVQRSEIKNSKIPRPPPTVMNSQFQSLQGQSNQTPAQNLSQNQNGMLNSQFSLNNNSDTQFQDAYQIACQQNPQHLSLFDSNAYTKNTNSMGSVFSTLNQNHNLSQQNSNRANNVTTIRLPKLSFNDLIQAQNYDSFKKFNDNNQYSLNEDSTENLMQRSDELLQNSIGFAQGNLIQVEQDDEELKSQEMSVFQSHKKYHNPADDSSILKYSHQNSVVIESSKTNPYRRDDGLNIASKFPKLKLITESELQSIDNQIFNIESQLKTNNYSNQDKENQQYQMNNANKDISPLRSKSRDSKILSKNQSQRTQKKENVIDSNIKLSIAFQTRKLLLKVWKTLLINKIQKMRANHLKRIAKNFVRQKQILKSWQNWKVYTKVILPQERLQRKAKEFHRKLLLEKSFLLLKQRAEKQKEMKAKLISTKLVLRSQKLRQVFSQLKQAVLEQRIERTRKLTGYHICYQKLKIKAFRTLQLNAKVNRRDRRVSQRTRIFYQQQLMKKALHALQQNSILKTEKKRRIISARQYFYNQYNYIIKNKAYQVLRQYAVHNRKNKLAHQQNRYWLLHRHFRNLKYLTYLKRGAKNQKQFLQRYHSHNLLIKSLKSLVLYNQEQKDKHYLICNYMARVKIRKIFRALNKYRYDNRIPFTPNCGPFLRCAQIILEHSFAKVMDNVWQDFPKQKQIKNKLTLHPNLMLNFIGLSKNLRYRSFFYEANDNLRQYYLKSVFKVIQDRARKMKEFKKDLRLKTSFNVLQVLKHQTQKNRYKKHVVQGKSKKNNLKLLKKVFRAFRKHTRQNRKMTKNFYKILLMRKKRILNEHLNLWMSKFSRIQQINQNEEVANKIYKHRNLSKFLALWLRQLHSKLKQDHLQILKQKFQRNFIRKRFLRQWYLIYRKQSYLTEQERQIEDHQTNLVQYKCFQRIKQYTTHKQKMRVRKQAADQEQRYWQAKKTLAFWHQGIENMRKQNELYQYIDTDRQTKLVVRVFDRLKLFKQFKIQRKLNDDILTKSIHSLVKNRVFRQWNGKLNKKISCNMISVLLKQIQLKLAFKQIQHIQAFYESTTEVMQEKRSSYLMLQFFNILKLNKKNIDKAQSNAETVQSKNKIFATAKFFNKWSKLYKQRRQMYVTYAFTVIQIKNQVLRGLLNDWKNHVGYLKLKKQGDKHKLTKVKRQVFRQLRLRSMKSQHYMASYDYLKAKYASKDKVQMFYSWRDRFMNKLQLIFRFQQSILNKKFKIFSIIKFYKAVQMQLKNDLACKRLYLTQVFKKLWFLKLSRTVKQRRELKGKLYSAIDFNQDYMFRKAVQTWIQYYRNHKQDIQKQIKIKRKSQNANVKKYMSQWIERASKSLRKLKGLKQMIKYRNKKMTLFRFAKWVDETNYFISLEQRIQQFNKHSQKNDKKYAIKQLTMFSKQRVVCKQRNQDIKEYQRKKYLIKILSCFQQYVSHRKNQYELYKIAIDQYVRKLKEVNFKTFRFLISQQNIINQQSIVMRQSQQRIYGSIVFAKLNENKTKRQNLKDQNYYSTQYRLSSLLQKSFGMFKLNKKQQKVKKQVSQHARLHQIIVTERKIFEKLRLYKCHNQLMKKKRMIMLQVIKGLDQEMMKRSLFKILVINMKNEFKNKYQIAQIMRQLKTKRLFNAMRQNQKAYSKSKQVEKQINKRKLRKLRNQYFNKWRALFQQLSIVKQHLTQKDLFTKKRVLDYLKQKQTNARKSYMIQVSQNVKTKAIVLTALIQNSQFRKLLNVKNQQAMINHNRSLAIKVFQAFELSKQNSVKVLKSHINVNYGLKVKTLHAFKFIIDRSNLVSQLENQTNLNLICSKFRDWQAAFQRKMQFKVKLATLLEKFEQVDKSHCFNQWKRGAYFMKTCELIYVFRYKEEEDSTKSSVLREWRRYTQYRQKRDYYQKSLQLNHTYHLAKEVLNKWRQNDRVKGTVLIQKLQNLINPIYQDGLESMFNYAIKDQNLDEKVQKFEKKRAKKEKKRFFYEWMIRLEKKEQLDILEQRRNDRLLKKCMRAFEIYRLKKIQQKYQMLKVIQFYGERRPELLLTFSKFFLGLNSEYAHTISSIDSNQKQARICSTALAKYVFEKWKNIKEVIQVENEQQRQADEFYSYQLAQKAINSWKEGVTVVCYKRNLKFSCQEFNNVSLMRKALKGLSFNLQKNAYHYHLEQCQHETQTIKNQNLSQKYFNQWRLRYNKKVHQRQGIEEIQARQSLQLICRVFTAYKGYHLRNKHKNNKIQTAIDYIEDNNYFKHLQKYFYVLRNYSVKKRCDRNEYRAKNQAAFDLMYDRLTRKYFTAYKKAIAEIKHKNKHSKLFSVFVAWKFYIRENKLVQKYLSECNFQSSTSNVNAQSKLKQRGSNFNTLNHPAQKRAISQEKENYEGLNESEMDIKYQRMDRQMSKNILIQNQIPDTKDILQSHNSRTRQPNGINVNQNLVFTPTLGSSLFKNHFQSVSSDNGSEKRQFNALQNSQHSNLPIFKQRFFNQK
ncbi:UNKNOWN [Stylonychia lemnae]|uniref:Uncharacterized protein n=1 Tax=Stylonychia lemnae TaxID=5949 RepID=A0A078BAA5_STYLE|nr:UNKNOWN [Stylonychia lemnae]|eukprot:CDW91171.1 UNKNOWN [Stylonychia lemnae]